MKRLLSMFIFSLSLSSTMLYAQSVRIDAQVVNQISIDNEIYNIERISGHPHPTRLVSATAGDPALNGLLLSLAVQSGKQWNTFFLKDTARYENLPSAKSGYLKLQLHTDTLDEAGHVRSEPSLLFINMTQAHTRNGFIEIQEIAQ